MKLSLVFIFLFVAGHASCQQINNKYLIFRTDYYSDTVLYKSKLVYFIEDSNNVLIQKNIPVIKPLWAYNGSGSPLIVKDSFYIDNFVFDRYAYKRNGNKIQLIRYNAEGKRGVINDEYSLLMSDTINGLINKRSLETYGFISKAGNSWYIGEELINLNKKTYTVYHFTEDHVIASSHPSHYRTDVYLEKERLIPVKFKTTIYDYHSGKATENYYVTEIAGTTDVFPDFSSKKEEDLILYVYTLKTWTAKQRQEFFARFPPERKEFCECLLKYLDGAIPYYEYAANPYYKKLVFSDLCN
ncbi:MAG: hypothetical protein NTW29_09000 [Bacteroidetes bacterium]|nr:hypothetical protein [Bacteroidota bacterium]